MSGHEIDPAEWLRSVERILGDNPGMSRKVAEEMACIVHTAKLPNNNRTRQILQRNEACKALPLVRIVPNDMVPANDMGVPENE